MPFVEIKLLEGISQEQKEKVIKNVTEAISSSLDKPKEWVQIAITEYKPDAWGKAGVQISKLD